LYAVFNIFRHQIKAEMYAVKNVVPKCRGGLQSQMIWACLAGNKLGPIVFIKGTVNAEAYTHMLNEHLLPFIDVLGTEGLTSITFQQDNASPHTAKKTQQFFESSMLEHGFILMDWPTNSPDLNPIENLWSRLKLELHRAYPDTSTLTGPPETVRSELSERLMKVWWSIGEDVLEGLVSTMPYRVNQVINAGGWYTTY